MHDLTLAPGEFRRFSVPHSLCLAGERQYLLGLGSVVWAAGLRVGAQVRETADEFRVILDCADRDVTVEADEVLSRAHDALGSLADRGADDLEGMEVSLWLGDAARCCPPHEVLCSPAVAVALACAVKAHRGGGGSVPCEELAEVASALLGEMAEPGRPYPQRYYALCCACLHGGALYASPSAEPLNVQLLIPPDSLILALDPAQEDISRAEGWEAELRSALGRLGSLDELLEDTEGDIAALFRLPRGTLSDSEAGILYGVLRVREMIREHVETMGSASDNDRLAEICDEESAILADYFAFPSEGLLALRQRAVEAGALGAKLTYAFGRRPAMIVLAPGRRDDVCAALVDEVGEACVLAADVDPDGVRSEEP